MFFSFVAHRDDDIDAYDLIYNVIPEVTEDQLFTDKSQRSFKRIIFTALALHAVLYKEELEYLRWENKKCKFDNYMRCLRMYFEATSEPFVTLSEMKHFLQVWLAHVNKTDLVGRYYEAYKELMPESAENFHPRKLTELCRVQIREYLCRYMSLPIAIENVNLPEKLKDFISFNLR